MALPFGEGSRLSIYPAAVKGICMLNYESKFVIVRPRPRASSRLFCFSHAGGGPAAFFGWLRYVAEDIECVCIQYPGRGQRLREQLLVSVDELVAEISHDLIDFCDKPFAFYGHSFGGIVAFELARQMRRCGMPGPSHLFAGATRPPHLEGPHLPIHMLPYQEFVESVQSRYGGIPEAIYQHEDLMNMFVPALRADFTAYETYECRAEDPLMIPITVFAGEDDTAVERACLHEWAMHTDAGFELKVLPGGHFFPATSASELMGTVEIEMANHLHEQNSSYAG